jgi:CBS domain containing-hemolysin-like protein
MQPLLTKTIMLMLLAAAQFLVAAGFTAFAKISRMSEDRVFPKGPGANSCPRMIHRGRLHAAMILVAVQVVIVVAVSRILPETVAAILEWSAGKHFLAVSAVPAAGVLLMVIAALAGIGIAVRHPAGMAGLVSYPFCPIYVLLRPFSGLLLRIISFVFPELPGELASPFMLIHHPEELGEGFIEDNGSRLVHSIVEFGEKKVREVMVPRIDVFAIEKGITMTEVRGVVSGGGHSRVPVYDGNIDRIIGMLYVKELVTVASGEEDRGIEHLTREPYFVPEGKKIDDLLKEFQIKKIHMAIVVDEYGGTSGIVTLEDILEEIVGEIRDEFDHEAPLVRKAGEGRYMVEGRTSLDDLGEMLGMKLVSEDVDTLGGFLFNLLGRVPEEGEEFEHEGITFRIERLDGQRIAEVVLTLAGADGGSTA